MNALKFEVEVKISISNAEAIESALLALGAKETNVEIQTDIYFDHPCRSFAETDEAVRIRSIGDIRELRESINIPPHKTEMTYKGPKIDSTTKTRLELSLGIDDIETAKTMLVELGFRRVASIRKHRSFFLLQDTTISIDEVEDIGTFLEFERVVASEEMIPPARDLIFSQLQELGIGQNELIRDSYLELYLRKMHP